MFGDVNTLFVFKCFLTTPSNVLPLPQANFPAHKLNFHWKWRWWDRIQAIFLNLFYLFNWNFIYLKACLKGEEFTRLTTRKAAELRTLWLGCANKYCSTQLFMVLTNQDWTYLFRATWIESQSNAGWGQVFANSHTLCITKLWKKNRIIIFL